MRHILTLVVIMKLFYFTNDSIKTRTIPQKFKLVYLTPISHPVQQTTSSTSFILSKLVIIIKITAVYFVLLSEYT